MNQEQITEQLIKLKYFKFVPQEELEATIKNTLKYLDKNLLGVDLDLGSEIEILASKDRRYWGIDGEDLAEGGIEKQIKEMEQLVLNAEGIFIKEISQDIWNNNGYIVYINGKEYRVYDESDIETKNIWLMSLIGLVNIVNDLLQQVNSDERLYGIHPDNDGAAVFLTEDQFNFLKEHNLNRDYHTKPNTLEELKKHLL